MCGSEVGVPDVYVTSLVERYIKDCTILADVYPVSAYVVLAVI